MNNPFSPIPAPPRLRDYDIVLLNSSGGKDSVVLIDEMVRQANAEGVPLSRLVVVHCDLGRVEWPGTRELAERQAKRYGLRFEVVSRSQDLLDQIEHRGMFPSAKARYCTSDHKRAQVYKVMTALVRAKYALGEAVSILNCLGIRADEGHERSKKSPFQRDRSASNSKRRVDTYFPVFYWTEADVWARIHAQNLEYHWAYDAGMRRLSCCFCVFAPKADLVLSARLNPGLGRAYAATEARIGHTFKSDLSMAQVVAEAEKLGHLLPPARKQLETRPLTVLWFGGGQDSTALFWLYVKSPRFREEFAKGRFIAVMAATGNEYPATDLHVQRTQALARAHGIEFYHIIPEYGYHGETWQSLPEQFDRNQTVMSVTFPKTCTDALKVQVCYRFLEQFLHEEYGYAAPDRSKRAFYQHLEQHGPITSLIGFAAGEESRCNAAFTGEVDQNAGIPVYRQKTVATRYPLVELGWDRTTCQLKIAGWGQVVPPPSNCMMCPFQNDIELVFLERYYPEEWAAWVRRERVRLDKHADNPRAMGVRGQKALPQVLRAAQAKFGSMSSLELLHHRMSHGHSVKSKY